MFPFFILSTTSMIFWIYILVAIVPALFLLRYIYKQDAIEHEPLGLIIKLLIQGVLAGLGAILLEKIGGFILPAFAEEGTATYTIFFAFLVVAAAEEGMKLVLMKRTTWKDPNFNFRFDGIVYSASVSLGFAAFENIGYVFSYGLSVAGPRALFAIPAHLGFSIFMGYFYGRAKLCDNIGDEVRKKRNMTAAYVSAVFLHGFYDSCAMISSTLSNVMFYIFVAVMYVIVIKLIKKEAATDRAI